jgi:cytochrome c peroxidase
MQSYPQLTKPTMALMLLGVLGVAAVPGATAGDLSNAQKLGELLYKDTNLSLERNQACESCHSLSRIRVPEEVRSGKFRERKQPAVSFADPDNIRNGTAVADGSVAGKFGTLNTPSAGYAAFSPFFHWDADEGLYVGGQFWNGRANSLAEQAAQPPLNPVEMAMPSKWAVVTRLKDNRRYVQLFKKIYDIDLDLIPAYEQAPAGLTPPPGVFAAYDAMTRAIGEFEKSRTFNRFDSKFDFVMAGVTEFSEQEQRGFELFTGDKALCSGCHVTDMTFAPDGNLFPALLTDFTYDNLGVPRNENIPGNPEPNPGLGGRPDIAARDPAGSEIGKHKVMSLRNIALTPPYMHNGAFSTLEEVVHFYNTRDVKPRVCTDINDPGFGDDCWPEPEFAATINVDELGDLGLTAEEEADLVAFMRTLTDNYPEWGKDPRVPRGTPSPYADVPFPPLP